MIRSKVLVGDGSKTNAWSDCWISPGIIIEDLDLEIPSDCAKAKVKDLVGNNGDCQWQKMNHWLPEDLLQKIKAILPPRRECGEDIFMYASFGSDNFSIKSNYDSIRPISNHADDIQWWKIWKLKVQERVHYFVWLMSHDRLLTNYDKSLKGLGGADCKSCGSAMEKTLHALRVCPSVYNFWVMVVASNIKESLFSMNLKEWINLNLNVNQYGPTLSAVGWHSFWTWRNKEYHDVKL